MKKFQTDQNTVMMQPVKEALTNHITNKIVTEVEDKVEDKVGDLKEMVNKKGNDIDDFIQEITETKKGDTEKGNP